MLKWLAVGIVGALLLAVGLVYGISEYKLQQTFDIEVEPVSIPTAAPALERGRLLSQYWHCVTCHGDDLGGKVSFNDFPMGRIVAPNLTSGGNGAAARYSNEDWVKAIRHGVNPDGKPLFVMPADYLYDMRDEELGALISYIESSPPVERELPDRAIWPVGRAFLAMGRFKFAAEKVDHSVHEQAPPPAATIEYGDYLGRMCRFCHGEDLGGAPDYEEILAAPNLTDGGPLADWSDDDFYTALISGMTPDGRQLDSEQMPWPVIGLLRDEELEALWLYCKSVPAVADH